MDVKQKLKVEVTGMTHEGLGVAKAEGFAIFIPGTLIGEKVICEIEKMEKTYAIARLIEILEVSKFRVKPQCEKCGTCGGCELMHLDYQKQLEFKVNMAEETLKRIGHLDLKVDEIIGMDNPYYYRNKVQIPFGTKNNKVICGYYKRKTHDIIPLDKCMIQPEYITEMILFIRNLANEYHISGYDEKTKKGCLRHILIRRNYQDDVMIAFITNEEKINQIDEIVKKIINRYPKVKSIIQNINTKGTNVILGDKHRLLFGTDYLTDKIKNLYFNISHYSFFQVNPIQTEKLYQRVLDYLKPTTNDIIIDGYCGVGTISLFLAKKSKYVYGIEVVKEAIDDAKKNAVLNKIENVEFIVGKVEEEIYQLIDKNVSALVLDPPRKGVDKEVLDKIIQANIPKMVYVSCDIATLARDLSILNEAYDIKKVTLVDMFAQTTGVETIALLELK